MSATHPALDLARANRLEKEGDATAAIAAYEQACANLPEERDSWFGLGRTCYSMGDHKRAIWALEQWLKRQSLDAEAWVFLGRLHTVNSYEKAEYCLRRALDIDPQCEDAIQPLFYALLQMGLTDALDETADSILRQHPAHLPTLIAQALSLPQVYQGHADLEHWRQRYMKGLNKLASLDPARLAAQNNIFELEWTNFYLAYQGEDDLEPQKKFNRFLRRILDASDITQFNRSRRRNKTADDASRIRVGFLSSFFRKCTIGRYFSSWVSDLPRDRFDVYLYFTGSHPDAVTKEIAANCACFRHLHVGLTTISQQLLDDDLDILIYPEVGMDGKVLVLANLRLATIQMAGWGHPVTTGSSTIDYYLSCSEMEPEDGAHHYSETLITLPGLGTRYACPAADRSATRTELHLPDDKNIYLIPQSLFKIHPDNDEIYMQILKRDDNAVLVFFRPLAPQVLDAFMQRLHRALQKHEIKARSQIKFLPRLSLDGFLAVNTVADVMLDSLHWSGGQTSLDALASDLPIVTLPGRFMRGRQTQAMLKIIGLPELIARSPAHFVDRAVEVATNKHYNRQLRQRLAEGKSKLFGQRQPTTRLAQVLEELHAGAGQSNTDGS